MSTAGSDGRRRLALRAFPPRWRERHGDELLHVSRELASTPRHDADWREFVDIVRGGLAVRLDDRPPLRLRFAYRWNETPVPPRWHAWMRDDLRGRFLGYRRSLRGFLPVLVVWFALGSFFGSPEEGPGRLATGLTFSAVYIVLGPFQARRTRKRMNAKVGYDIVAAGAFPPPTRLPAPVLRRPAARAPYVGYAIPFAVWSTISGTALIAGAALPNAPDRSVGPSTFASDPNSPLTPDQVAVIGAGVAIAAIVVALATTVVTRLRVRRLAATTAHASLPLSAREMWSAATIVGALATLLGALGILPDLASAAIGAALVIAGAAGGSAAWVVARCDAELGRHISFAELVFGERDPAAGSVRQPARQS